jgi:hypothetical protein
LDFPEGASSKVLFQPGSDLIMITDHHQLQAAWFEEEKNNSDAA